MFTRIGEAALKKDLHNTITMCAALGNPQNRFKTIHVAGTNGKGSTSHMLAAILQQAGYKTGLYTSPHLKDFRERIRVNGKMVAKSFVTKFVNQEQKIITELKPSFFEVTVAMAFEYFAKEKIDIAIVEVGLGGRLDSTNVITPILSVITNISLDHTNILGNTLAAICTEKAGIIKTNVPVIIGEMQEETNQIFTTKAAENTSNITFANQKLQLENVHQKGTNLVLSVLENGKCLHKDLALDLTGTYQQKNILTVIAATLAIKNFGYQITNKAIYTALKNVKKITGLQGRWQTLAKNPLTICDTGHNKAGIAEILLNIAATPHQNLHVVIGMVKDKDINGILALLPKNASYYFCQPMLERALPIKDLQEMAAQNQLHGKTYQNVNAAYLAAKEMANSKDLIFIGGSTFVVAEVL